MFEVGNNNNGNVHISNVAFNKNDFLPCECCGIRFLSVEKYQASPYCNSCITFQRQKNQIFFKKIGILIATTLSMLKVIEVNSIKVFPDFLLPYATEIRGLVPFAFQNMVSPLLHLFSMILLVILTFLIIVGGFQLIAYFDNRHRFPYH